MGRDLQRPENIPFKLFGELMIKMTVKDWIEKSTTKKITERGKNDKNCRNCAIETAQTILIKRTG